MPRHIIHQPRLLGDRLRRLRIGRDWTVERLATAAGISKAYLSMIEGGKREPHWSILMRIVRSLGSTLCALLTDAESIPRADDDIHSRRSSRLVLEGPEPDEKGALPLPPPSGYTHILTPWHKGLQSEVIEIYLEPHSEWTPDPVSIPGQIVCVGIQGRLLLVTQETEYDMREGETLQYDGSHAHSLRNYTDNPTRTIMVVTPVAI